jgi:hypothetical protein
VSSRTPKASAMRRLVHPASVNSIARARSASPRSCDRLSSTKAWPRCVRYDRRLASHGVLSHYKSSCHCDSTLRSVDRPMQACLGGLVDRLPYNGHHDAGELGF